MFQPRLKSFLLEIECPSGAKLLGDLYDVTKLVAEFDEIPPRVIDIVDANETRIFNYIWTVSLRDLLRVMQALGSGTYDPLVDQTAWTAVQTQLLSGSSAPNPFVIRIIPRSTEQPAEIFQDIKGIAERTLERLREGNIEGAVNLLSGLVTACNKPLDNATAGDGWGHAHEADTVEALLREGTAMFEGTDKHEQMFKDMDDKVKIESLVKLVMSLEESRRAQIKANQLHDERIKALELGMTHLQGEYMALLKSTQKLHRHLKIDVLRETYGGLDRDVKRAQDLARTRVELGEILKLAARIQSDPILRQILG